jgi:hypothetical protein
MKVKSSHNVEELKTAWGDWIYQNKVTWESQREQAAYM